MRPWPVNTTTPRCRLQTWHVAPSRVTGGDVVVAAHSDLWHRAQVPAAPVEIAIVNDYELIVEGLAAVLRPHRDRVRVRDTFVIGEDIEIPPLHLALFDTYGRVGIAEPALRTLTEHPAIGHVAIFSLDFAPPLLDAARTLGIRAFISKTLDAVEIVEAAVRDRKSVV